MSGLKINSFIIMFYLKKEDLLQSDIPWQIFNGEIVKTNCLIEGAEIQQCSLYCKMI